MPRNPLIYAAIGIMVLSLIVGVVLIPRRKPVPAAAPPQPVKQVFADVDIPPHTAITLSMLREASTTNPVPGVATDVNEVVGRIALKLIGRNQPIQRSLLSARVGSSEPMTTFHIPANKRAIGLAFDPRSAARVATPGDRVDIIAVYRDGADAVARTIAQDAEVLATDESFAATTTPPGSAGASPSPAGQPPERKEILVIAAVTPQEAQQIVAASERGTLKIVLRNPRNPLHVQLEESWEHPRKPHKHYEPLNVARAGSSAQPAPQPARTTAARRPPLPPPAPIWTPPSGGPLPPVTIEPKPKTVQVIKGTQVQTVQFTP
ncbi:MAG: Flp pilus assembly protein CpaB [Abditibacteriales bacterium]|nr:Flp pilus assembly protein CpaB [Abditibacteriales bacterium]MDW8368525.1 Flp pilus assembly protein CpaB [Abditibacteriales bacterium]